MGADRALCCPDSDGTRGILRSLPCGQLLNPGPIGLVLGLSVVVASIMLATICELKKLIFKENWVK